MSDADIQVQRKGGQIFVQFESDGGQSVRIQFSPSSALKLAAVLVTSADQAMAWLQKKANQKSEIEQQREQDLIEEWGAVH